MPVKSSTALLEPGLVGIWRPVLILPQGIATHLSPLEMRTILAHEYCHLRRRDNLLAEIEKCYGDAPLEVLDPGRNTARYAWIIDGRLAAVLYLADERPEAARNWLAGLIGHELEDPASRLAVLAGSAPSGCQDTGPIICACFSVGLSTLQTAIRDQSLVSVGEIGAALRAGTGCGSCVPELRRVLAETNPAIAL